MSKRNRNNIPDYRRQDLRPERTQEQKPGASNNPESSLIEDEHNEIGEIRVQVEETLENKHKRRQ